MKNQIDPRRGRHYTARQLLTGEIYLRDSPFFNLTLSFEGRMVRTVIQHSHVTNEELLGVPGFADSLWRYLRETDEWCPIFEFVGTAEQAALLVDTERDNVSKYELEHEGLSKYLWTTPKGLPREQYYDKNGLCSLDK